MRRSLTFIVLAAAMAAAFCGCEGSGGHLLSIGKPGLSEQDAWTIQLMTFSDPAKHVEEAKYYKEQTEKLAGWHGLYVVHEDNHSELYWGTYRTPKHASANLKKAKAFRTSVGIPVYNKAMVVPLAGKDIGPAEWNLLNAKGQYSVVIATFYDVPEANYYGRKNHAVAYCQQLREKDRDAYYYHGAAESAVTVEVFPDSAVTTVKEKGIERRVICESHVHEIISQFKYLAVNGRMLKQKTLEPGTGQIKWIPSKPYLTRIPRRKGGLQADALDSFSN